MKKILLIVFLILIFDQSIKIFVKTHFQIGESLKIFPWFFIYFIENPGMAYGISLFPGYIGKIILCCFRIIIIISIILIIFKYYKKKKSNYFIVPISMIFSGAIGNLIDNIFYGIIFDFGVIFNEKCHCWINYSGLSHFKIPGYSFFMGGNVVDMFYFPIFNSFFPKWIPFLGGKQFEFFKPIFNLSDIFIFIGTVFIIIFNKKK